MTAIKPADPFTPITFNLLINPEGQIQVIATSNSPSVRPDLAVVLDGIIGTQERGLPIRGTHV